MSGEVSGEVISNLRSYIFFKRGSQAKVWEKTSQTKRITHGRPAVRWGFSSFHLWKSEHEQEAVGDKDDEVGI